MIIDVNPQTITEIAQTIANAYGEVEEAARILTSITEHNNWNCKERDAINDYTQSNAREILKISEKSGNFANVMKMVAENFTTDEKNISEMFTSVESMIGSILSIRPIGAGNRTSNLPEGVMPICKSGGPEDFKLSSLLAQAGEMQNLTAEYEALFSKVTGTLNDTNNHWSELLAHNFAGKISSAQQSFASITELLSSGAVAAKNSATTMQSVPDRYKV